MVHPTRGTLEKWFMGPMGQWKNSSWDQRNTRKMVYGTKGTLEKWFMGPKGH